jgi:hypothetical protein
VRALERLAPVVEQLAGSRQLGLRGAWGDLTGRREHREAAAQVVSRLLPGRLGREGDVRVAIGESRRDLDARADTAVEQRTIPLGLHAALVGEIRLDLPIEHGRSHGQPLDLPGQRGRAGPALELGEDVRVIGFGGRAVRLAFAFEVVPQQEARHSPGQ